MAAFGWRKDRAVGAALFGEGHRFDFHQAVRLLEILFPGRTGVGEGTEPEREVVRFKSRVGLDFPASDVVEVRRRRGREGAPAEMVVSFLGLAGQFGPLPQSFAELILERVGQHDFALRDFLDLFNHRLASLLYRVRKKYLPVMEQKPPDEGLMATSLFSLAGLGTPGLLGRMGVQDRALLLYTGLLVGSPHTMVGLEEMLSHYFAVEARVEPFRGGWLVLDPEQRTALGARTGCNHRLGEEALLGSRVWDQGAGFELRLGPMSLRRFLSFLPSGHAFASLVALVRFYVGEELGFSVRLVLAAAEVPELRLGPAGDSRLGWSARLPAPRPEVPRPAGGDGGEAPLLRLGRAGGGRLGWTTWLRIRAPERDDGQVVFVGRH
jgi:type VI secretion system protein ImpH